MTWDEIDLLVDTDPLALRDEAWRLTQLLTDLIQEDPCDFDHHGYCQAHIWFRTDPSCPQSRAKEILGL